MHFRKAAAVDAMRQLPEWRLPFSAILEVNKAHITMNTLHSTSSSEWERFKREAFEQLRRDIAVAFELMEGARLRAELRTLRRRHHILVIAERLQRWTMERGQAVPPDLIGAAELVFEKRGHIASNPDRDGRTADEERFLGSARVRWHKLLKEFKNGSTSSSFERRSQGDGAALPAGATKLRTDEASLETILRVIDSAAATSLLLSSQLRTLAHQLRPLVSQIAPRRSEGGEQPE